MSSDDDIDPRLMHRESIEFYRRILEERLTDYERSYVQRRLVEACFALRELTESEQSAHTFSSRAYAAGGGRGRSNLVAWPLSRGIRGGGLNAERGEGIEVHPLHWDD